MQRLATLDTSAPTCMLEINYVNMQHNFVDMQNDLSRISHVDIIKMHVNIHCALTYLFILHVGDRIVSAYYTSDDVHLVHLDESHSIETEQASFFSDFPKRLPS